MKILQLISSGGMYGAEAVILNLSHALGAAGHESIIGVFANSANLNIELHTVAIAQGLHSVKIPCKGQLDTGLPQRLRRLAAELEVDIVHAHGYKADLYAAAAFRKGESPLVSTCHNWIDNAARTIVYGMLDRVALRRFGAVIAVSAAVRARLLAAGVSADRIELVKNGIDLAPFLHAAPSLTSLPGISSAPVVGIVGRIGHEKGIDIFVRSARRVLDSVPEVRFLIVGDGPDRLQIEDLIRELQLEASVELVGRRSDMPGVYASFDVMVSSSRLEGLPMAILEGMASGRAIVATAVGDVPSIILDRNTGRLVPSEDVEALSDAIVSLLRCPEERLRLGAAARSLVEENFSARSMADCHLRIYERQAAPAVSALPRPGGRSAQEADLQS